MIQHTFMNSPPLGLVWEREKVLPLSWKSSICPSMNLSFPVRGTQSYEFLCYLLAISLTRYACISKKYVLFSFVCGTYIDTVYFLLQSAFWTQDYFSESHLWLLCVAVINLVFFLGGGRVMFSILQINTSQFIYLFYCWQTFQLFLGFCCSKHCHYEHSCTCFWMSVCKNFSKTHT